MTFEFEFLHLPIGDFDAGSIIGVVQTCIDFQASFSSSSGEEVQDGFVIQQRLCSPVDADEGEHPVFNRIPFGRAGRIVADLDGHTESITESVLKLVLP